jgi:RHS repeat-associated protein
MKHIITLLFILFTTTFWGQGKVPTFNQVPAICYGDQLAPLPTNSLEGISGVWSPETDNTQTTLYTFTPYDGQGAITTTIEIQVTQPYMPTFTEVSAICAGESINPLPLVSLEGISGTWSPELNNQETTTYIFTPNIGQCASLTILTITINPQIIPSFSEIDPICTGSYLEPLPTTSLDGIVGTWSPALDNTNTKTYTFTPYQSQCAQSTELTITVNPVTIPKFDDIEPLCSENTINVLSPVSSEGIFGTWSPEFDSKNTTVYTFTPDEGQCAGTTTLQIKIIESDIPVFDEVTPVCSGEFVNELPAISNNGISGIWSPEIDNTVTTTYTFTPDPLYCSSVATLTITIDPKLPTFREIPPICQGEVINDLPTTSDEGYTGSWSPNKVDNSVTTTYTFTPDEGQCASPVNLTIIVHQYEVDFSDLLTCLDTEIQDLPLFSNNGIPGKWYKDKDKFVFTPDSKCVKDLVTISPSPYIIPVFEAINPIEAGSMIEELSSISTNGITGTWSPELNNLETTTYTFTPTPGQCAKNTTLTIEVNSVLQFNASSGADLISSENNATIVNLSATPTGNSKEVGNTSGELSVSNSGSANYTIPVMAPPGINGVAPQISIVYDSQSGEGMAGYGWSISGVSAITRIPSTIFHDGISDPVDLDSYDRFALDGQRLMLKTGTYGTLNSTYETEHFSNKKITYTGTSFKVEYPDGAVAYYGLTDNSRDLISYAVSYWENPQGLRVTYDYLKLSNKIYIVAIKYGSKGSAASINSIAFKYKNRLRREQNYIGGQLQENGIILSEIVTKSNNKGYRSYVLSHINMLQYEVLKSIKEFNGDKTKSYNPTVFSYDNETNNNIITRHLPNTSGLYNTMGDFDGDGDMDGLGDGWKILMNISEYGLSPNELDYSYLQPAFADNGEGPEYVVKALKIASDGSKKLLNRDAWCFEQIKMTLTSTGAPEKTRFNFHVLALKDNMTEVEILSSKEITFDQVNKAFLKSLTGDFDGDGVTDKLLLRLTPHNASFAADVYLVRLDSQSTFPDKIGEVDIPREYDRDAIMRTADFNGDGRTDIAIVRGKAKKVSIYTIDQNGNFVLLWETSVNFVIPAGAYYSFLYQLEVTPHGNVSHYYHPIFLDVNGDGKTDIIFPGFERLLLLSTGIGFNSESLPNTFPSSVKFNAIPADFNNDGKADLVQIYNNSETSYAISLLSRLAPGNWTESRTDFNVDKGSCTIYTLPYYQIEISPVAFKTSKLYGDKPQLITSEKYRHNCGLTSRTGLYTYHNVMSSNKLLNNITYGNGAKENIYYTQMAPSYGSYKAAGQVEVYPNYDVPSSSTTKLVRNISREISLGKYQHKFYKYYGATSNAEGLGFLGFKAVAQTNWFFSYEDIVSTVTINNMALRGTPSQSFSVAGDVLPTKTLLTNDPYISKSLFTYNNNLSDNPIQGNKVFKLRNTFTQIYNGLDGTVNDITSTYDTYNVKNIKTVQYSSNSPESKIIEQAYEYENLSSPYLVGRPKNKIVTSKLGSDKSIIEEVYTYEGNLLRETKKRATNSGITTDFITESNDYDSYGNIIQKTLSAPGMDDRTSSFEYDQQTHRFATKKTDFIGLSTSFTYDLNTGRMLSQTMPSISGFPIKTTFSYDTWGKVTNSTQYLGNASVLSTTETYAIVPEGVQKTLTSNDGSGSKIFYDYVGRKIHEQTKDINNRWTCISTIYNHSNQPLKISQPYFIEGNNLGGFTVWDEIQYDVYGRIIQSNVLKSSTSNGEQKTYSYSGLSVTENNGSKQKITTKNAFGSISEINEPGGATINNSYFANGNLKSTQTGGGSTVIEQDGFGRKKTLYDPSAGTYMYRYNDFGELLSEEIKDKGITEYKLDDYGRITEKTITGYGDDVTNSTTTYLYNAYNKLYDIQFTDNTNNYRISYAYNYDIFFRIINTRELRTGPASSDKNFDFKKEFLYDAFSRPEREKYYAKDVLTNKAVEKWIKTTYKNGYQFQLYDMPSSTATGNKLWQTDLTNARGNLVNATLGNGVTIFNVNNSYGIPQLALHYKNSSMVMSLSSVFTLSTGNLKKRQYAMPNLAWTENLTYDEFDRVKTYKNKSGYQSQSYNGNGTISQNEVGGYEYNLQGKPYKQTSLIPVNQTTLDYYDQREQEISYNVFNSPVSIYENNIERLDFDYNPFGQRSVMYYGDLEKTKTSRIMRKFYNEDGSMEITRKSVSGSTTDEFIIYIGGDGYSAPVILKSDGTNKNYYYLHRDYQGTILAITDQTGNAVEKRLYDIWGAMVGYNNGITTTIPTSSKSMFLDRGYTGHEHMLGVGLINMNGRIYDPKLHRFLQADNNLQDPLNPQNFNRFGYCMNNPTKYADASGESFGLFIVGFFVSAYIHGAQATGQANPLKWNAGQFANAFGAPVSQVISLGVTNFANHYIDNYNKVELKGLGATTTDGQNYVSSRSYTWGDFKYDWNKYVNRIDSAFDDGSEKVFQVGMDFVPFVAGANAYMGATQGQDMYGNEMSNGDTAIAVASIVPFGKFSKFLKFGSFADEIAKGSNRVFWSGGKEAMDGAMSFAKAKGMKTLEMTFWGRLMNNLNPIVPRSISTPIWNRLSQQFATGTRGTAHFVTTPAGPRSSSIWLTVEKPILDENGVNIITHIFD